MIPVGYIIKKLIKTDKSGLMMEFLNLEKKKFYIILIIQKNLLMFI